jgi:hypothetical protein
MPDVKYKVGRNDACLCGSGKKAKYCCGSDDRSANRSDAEFLKRLAERDTTELERLCEDCQMDVWLEVIDLPDRDDTCRLAVPDPRPAGVSALQAALKRADPDGVADELAGALREVDGPASRAQIARAVLAGEASGRVRAVVAQAAIADLAESGQSVLLMAAVLSGLAAEVGVRPGRLARVMQAARARRFGYGAQASRCRRKLVTSG